MSAIRMVFWDKLGDLCYWAYRAGDRATEFCNDRYHLAQRDRYPHLFKAR